jgi:hypothetical protein
LSAGDDEAETLCVPCQFQARNWNNLACRPAAEGVEADQQEQPRGRRNLQQIFPTPTSKLVEEVVFLEIFEGDEVESRKYGDVEEVEIVLCLPM